MLKHIKSLTAYCSLCVSVSISELLVFGHVVCSYMYTSALFINKLWQQYYHNVATLSILLLHSFYQVWCVVVLQLAIWTCPSYCYCCGMKVHCLPTNYDNIIFLTFVSIAIHIHILCSYQSFAKWVTWTCTFPLFLVVIRKWYCLPTNYYKSGVKSLNRPFYQVSCM